MSYSNSPSLGEMNGRRTMSAAHRTTHNHNHNHDYNYNTHASASSFDRLFASSQGAWIAAGIALLYLLYNFLPSSLLPGLLWNVLVSITPAKLIIAVDKKMNPDMYDGTIAPQSGGDMYAFKSEALRRVFGLESGAVAALPGASSLRRASWLGGLTSRSDAPPGLGNWDNSCYQNSVLQGLSALKSFAAYLEDSEVANINDSSTTVGSLRDTMTKLNDPENNGRRLWTPAKLKSMSSWQQQDAQEYFSKIMDDMEKETIKAKKAAPTTAGLAEINSLNTVRASGENQDNTTQERDTRRNPLDGFLAQRVACTSCDFSEGLSMIPFNCLTVPLGRDYSYKVEQCLDEYTNLEEISGVECGKCTLLRTRAQLQQMTTESAGGSDPSVPSAVSLPPEVRTMVMSRLQAVQQALEKDDFSDETLNKKCQIPKKARVSSTKTRQAVVARPPKSLVIHVNRSVFDEYTGAQRKNLADVTYPRILNLGPWCLGTLQDGDGKEEWRMDPSRSMIASSRSGKSATHMQYVLRAAVTHYGRHENGHYICYREHPELSPDSESDGQSKAKPSKWWRLSDDDVSAVTEEQVLNQGGVFMLFYEHLEDSPSYPISPAVQESKQEYAAPVTSPDDLATEAEDEKADVQLPEEATVADAVPEPTPQTHYDKVLPSEFDIRRLSTPQMMRTAGDNSKRGKGDLPSTFRAMAAT